MDRLLSLFPSVLNMATIVGADERDEGFDGHTGECVSEDKPDYTMS